MLRLDFGGFMIRGFLFNWLFYCFSATMKKTSDKPMKAAGPSSTMFFMVQDYSEYSTIQVRKNRITWDWIGMVSVRSIQGIIYIFKNGQSIFGRLFWIFVVLLMLWLSCYMSWLVATFFIS